MDGTIYNTQTGKSRTMPEAEASKLVRNSPGEWSFAQPLPYGWDREVPRYRSPGAVLPAALPRHIHEPPFTSSVGSERCWQYGTRPIAAGEIVSTWEWPFPDWQPLNETARRVHSFFSLQMKSRLTRSPFLNGKLSLGTGLDGRPVTAEMVMPPKPEPMNLAPAGR